MLHNRCLGKNWSFYHIEDNINCLELRIYLRFINSVVKLPKYEIKSRARTWSFSSVCTQSQRQQQFFPIAMDEDSTLKIVVVKWQQKLLSTYEVELYSNLKNCTNNIQKKYHQYLRAAKHSNIRQKHKSCKRPSRTHASNIRSKSNTAGIDFGNNIFTYINDDKYHENRNKVSKVAYTDDDTVETMYIYANLNPNIMLARMKWHKRQRILQIYPDFTQFNTCPYLIQLNTDYRQLYMYGIQNISTIRPNKLNLNQDFSNVVRIQQHQSPNSDNITQGFVKLPKRMQRSVILLEIQNISHFSTNNIHVRQKTILPTNTILEEGLLEGSTHTIVSASANKFNASNVGYCWQLTILSEEEYDLNNTVYIIFEVISIDYWQRERLEGYVYYNFNLFQPGTECVTLTCTRVKNNVWHTFKNYLIGGRHRFDYYAFTTTNKSAVDNEPVDIYNYYGIRTETTGQLSIKCQKIIQSNCKILHQSSVSSNRTAQGMTLDDIMMAYQEARKQLQIINMN